MCSSSTLATGRRSAGRTPPALRRDDASQGNADAVSSREARQSLLAGFDELEAVRRVEPKVVPLPLPALDRLHRELTLKISISGLPAVSPRTPPLHRAIAALKHGDSLRLEGRELRDAKAGRSASSPRNTSCRRAPYSALAFSRAFTVLAISPRRAIGSG